MLLRRLRVSGLLLVVRMAALLVGLSGLGVQGARDAEEEVVGLDGYGGPEGFWECRVPSLRGIQIQNLARN